MNAMTVCQKRKQESKIAHTRIYTYFAENGCDSEIINFVVMIMTFGTGIEIDVFYTMITKTIMTSLLLRNYDVITYILADE